MLPHRVACASVASSLRGYVPGRRAYGFNICYLVVSAKNQKAKNQFTFFPRDNQTKFKAPIHHKTRHIEWSQHGSCPRWSIPDESPATSVSVPSTATAVARAPCAMRIGSAASSKLAASKERTSPSLVPQCTCVLEAAESATSAGPFGRTTACHGALSGSAARPECAAQPGAKRVSHRRPGRRAVAPARRFSQHGGCTRAPPTASAIGRPLGRRASWESSHSALSSGLSGARHTRTAPS